MMFGLGCKASHEYVKDVHGDQLPKFEFYLDIMRSLEEGFGEVLGGFTGYLAPRD